MTIFFQPAHSHPKLYEISVTYAVYDTPDDVDAFLQKMYDKADAEEIDDPIEAAMRAHRQMYAEPLNDPIYKEAYAYQMPMKNGLYLLGGEMLCQDMKVVSCAYHNEAFNAYHKIKKERRITVKDMLACSKIAAYLATDLYCAKAFRNNAIAIEDTAFCCNQDDKEMTFRTLVGVDDVTDAADVAEKQKHVATRTRMKSSFAVLNAENTGPDYQDPHAAVYTNANHALIIKARYV